jgi:hypothetical protein
MSEIFVVIPAKFVSIPKRIPAFAGMTENELPCIHRHPNESWGPPNHFSNGTASGDAGFRRHDGK